MHIRAPSAGAVVKVLWTHNFNPTKTSAGVFMFKAADGLRSAGVDVDLQYLGNLRSPTNLLKARRQIENRAEGFDLVHAQFGSACSLVTAAVRTCPKIVSIRGNDWNLHKETFGFLAGHTRLARLMTWHSLPKYDLCITVSRRMETDLRKHFGRMSFAPLPAPIDLEMFKPRKKREARDALGFPDNSERWVLFNSLRLDDPVKRYPLAARAVELARRRMSNIRLRVAHDIPYEKMPLFVAACDLILCTSETEGWPNSVKEALACDLPFVSTDVSDLGRIAAVEPSCRIVPADPAALADAICETLDSDPAADLRRHVVPMGLRETSETMLALYRRVLGKAGVA